MRIKQPGFRLLLQIFGLFLLVVALHLIGAEPPKAGTNDFAVYAGSKSCQECHKVEYQRWSQSPHGLAERLLQPELDQSSFAPSRTFKHGSQTSTVRIQNGEFQIVTLGFKTNVEPYRVERVIGQYPIRQFLTPAPGGRWQVQEVSYATQSNQWFDVYGNEDRQPGEWGHWTGRGMNWNSQCAECHNTGLKKNYDAATDSYHTTMMERGVSCEACHGPLKTHNDWQQKHPDSKQRDPTVASLGPVRIQDMCASCHARQRDLTGDFKPGDSFFDHYSLETLDYARRWYPDGQIKDEDYEFVSSMGSKMYQAGVTCLDCHTRDVNKPQLRGNDLCLRCHNGGNPKSPVIDPAEHGHHKLTDHGSDCIGCHMPVTVYMQRHPRHDHGFTIPDPLLTKELGIPNACNRCHTDKTTDWAVKYTDEWYGTNMNRPTRDRARWIAAAENGEVGAEDKMTGLLDDTNQNPYWRAVAATFLDQWANDPSVQTALLAQVKNEHPLVRERVVRSLEPVVQKTEVQSTLKSLLNDPRRNVRVAAAWVLRRTVDMKSQAGRELQRMLDLDADQPTGQFEEAMLLLSRQQPAKALAHLKKATAWDPLSPPFLCAQAQVQDQLGQTEKALATLNQAAAAVPNDPHVPYVRATILVRNKRYDEARVAANRALALQQDFQPALELLQKLPANH